MELWIRSQNKEVLMKIDHLYLDGTYKDTIVGYCQSTFTSPVLGRYMTNSRAKEVLNEIQNLLNPVLIYKNITQDENSINLLDKRFGIEHICTNNNADIKFLKDTIVYEMPKE